MATKIKTFVDSKSGHAANASMSNQVASYLVWREIAEKVGKELAWKALKSINFAGYTRMNTIPAPVQAFVLFALSDGVWGNHPYHANVKESLVLIADKSIDSPFRYSVAEVMVKHPDKGLHAWIKDVILEKSGFTVEQLITLGLRQPEVKVTPAANVVNENEIIAKLARKLGISYQDALAFANSDDDVSEPEQVSATPVKTVVTDNGMKVSATVARKRK